MRGVRGNVAEKLETQDAEQPKRGRPAEIKLFNYVMKPFTSKEDLPEDVTSEKRGNVTVVKQGSPRFYYCGNRVDGYKLIKVYRAKGIKQSLVSTIKPHGESKRNKKDAKLFAIMKKAHIPLRESING